MMKILNQYYTQGMMKKVMMNGMLNNIWLSMEIMKEKKIKMRMRYDQ